MDCVKLRVYHRTQDDIVLLWSYDKLNDDQKNNVKILCNGVTLKFANTLHEEEVKPGIPKHTVICVVQHESNGLKFDAKYNLQIILGGVTGDALVRKILVLEYGVLPQYEKDRKSSRVHLMAWDYISKQWIKLPIIKTKIGYAVPTINVKE